MDLHFILLKAHSGIRWLVLVVAIIAIVKLLITWLGKKEFDKMDNGITRGFVGLLDLQMLLGLSLVVWFLVNAGTLDHFRIEHAVTNLIAIIVAHVGVKKWRGAPGPIRARNTLLMFILAFLLIGVAISRLPQGWGMS